MIRKSCRAFSLRVLLAAGLLLSTALGAATFDILVDKDNNTGTGCTVATAAGPFAGVEFIVTTTVDTGVYPPVVAGVARRDCASPPTTFGPAVAIDAGGWPVGIGTGAAGYDVLETYFPVSSPYGQYRMGFVYSDPNTGSDAVVTTNGQAGGNAIFFELGPFPVIPTLAHGTLLLLAFALAWFALRRLRQHKVSTLVFCGVLASIVAGTTWAAIVLNGLIDDWTGVPVLASDPTGDAPGGADMAAIYAKLEVVKMFVRADVKTASPPSFTSGNATTFTVGSAGNFPIATFGIPAVNSITQGGTLPGGVSFVYTAGQSTASLAGTPNAGTGGIYPLTFTAVNGVPPPAVQNFTLTVNQAPAITSAGATTFIVGTPGTFTFTATGFPLPALTLTGCSPALPGGLTFTDLGNGTATLAGSAALGSVGTKNCTLTASNGVGAPVPLPFALTVAKAPTTTTVVSDINPSVIGQTVTFTATVTATPPGSGTPTGLVQFKDAGNPIGAPVALAGGTASYSTAALILGAHPITADYLGDVDFVVSAGTLPTQTVNKAETTTTVVSNINPSVFGQSVTFTATVAASPPGSGTPTGTVQFMDGASPLGAPVPLVGGTAALPTAALSTGVHAISANYAGDANFNTSSGMLPTQTVNKAGTTTTLAAAPNPSVFGQSVTLTATVAATAPGAGLPTGTVNFFDGITPIGSGVLDAGGVATLTTAALAVNAHQVSAQYAGDTNFNTSTSNIVGQTVNKAGTTTGVVSDANPSVFSQPVTFTATVSPVAPGAGTPTGTVTFKDGITVLCNAVALGGATAICTTSTLAAGGHAISVDYSGDGNFNLSSSGVLTQTVNAASTTTVLDAGSPTVFGQSATLTATVGVGPPGTAVPTGTVNFLDGMTLLGSGTLNAAGVATFSTTTLAVGPHVLNAQYVGNASFSASSGSAGKTVGAAATTTALGSSSNPALAGSSVTFTATVAAVAPGSGIPTGNVMFFDGAVPLGAVPLNALGQAALSTVALTPGAHGITATYGGVPEYSGSTSAILSQAITLAPSFTSAAGTTFLVGAPGTFAITATGFPAPTLSSGACAPLLPASVSFTGSGTTAMSIAGTPPVGSGGAYTCALTAANGVGSDAGQSFTLTIDEGPTAVDDPQYTVLNGETLITTGGQLPPPAAQAQPEKLSPALPPEPGLVANDLLGFPAATVVAFGGGSLGGVVTDNAAGATVPFGPGHVLQVNADGSFTFTAAAGSYGNVTFLYRIQNGTGFSDATVTIGVHKAPLITSAATTAFLPGSPGTFTVTTSGFPLPALSIDAFTPAAAWLSFTDNGDGTATLAGTPPAMATGSITFAITAHNIIAPDDIQNFTLQLQSPPAFTSPNALTCVVGTPCPAFTVAASGVPTPTLSEVGTLPGGVSFTPATGALAGTPAAGTGGVYNITFGATNGVLPDAAQPFTLTINEAPGASTGPTPVTFVVGTLNTATYTATGYPLPTFTLTGCPTLPPAITLSPTGMLSGTAVAGTGGDFNCTVTANNGIGSNTTLPIVVQVREAPAFTSASTHTCVVGAPCPPLNVTASGFPAPTLTAGVCTPALPAPVAFTGSGTTTMSLGGTPPAFSGGTFSCALTASNGIGSTATQTLVLTINQPPAITSAASTVFTEGVAGAFTVITTGFPTNASMLITQSGATLPGALTFTNNNNGTATLAGTPNAATAGLYVLTITANNGIGAPAVLNPFNLRVCPIITIGALSAQPTRTNPYTASVTAVGGTGPYTYAITAAPSPLTGATLGSNGVFSGTVTAAGPYSFTITATDSNGCTGSTPYSGTINEPPTVVNESYQAVGNTPLRVAASDGVTVPHLYVASANGVLANDNNGNGGGSGVGISAVAGTFATTGGGSITLAADGTFTYTPLVNFTGADTYVYTVSDGIGTATGTVTFNVSTKIWYVKNDAGGGGTGAAGSPFNTLAAAVTASAASDTIFVFFGDGTTTGQNAGAVLKANQRLLGEAVALTANGTFNSVVNPQLRAAGSRPLIDNTAASSDGVAATNIAGVEIRGLSIGGTQHAINVTTNAAGSGGATIADNIIRLPGTDGIHVAAGGTGTLTLAIQNNSITGNARGMNLQRTAGTLLITAFNDNTISGNSLGTGIDINGAVFDAVAGNPLNTVSGGVMAIGQSGNGVTSSGMLLQNVTGDLSFTDLDIYNDAGTGLLVSGTGALNAGAGTGFRIVVGAGVGTLDSSGGPALSVNNASIALPLNFVRSTNSVTTGVSLVSAFGGVGNTAFSASSGQIVDPVGASGTAFNVSGGNGNISFDGPISSTSGNAVVIANRGSDAVTFSGAVTETGSGISLSSNSGAEITFRGGLSASTGTNAAFSATGGGTINVCDDNPCNPAATGLLVNTLTTTTGTALNVTNTTIGANKLEFRSITAGTAASGPANGIVLNNTGAVGNLKVAGTGGAATGGTIQKTTGDGVSLAATLSPTFDRMSIKDTGGYGIRGTAVTNFTLTNSTIDNSGTALGVEAANVGFNTTAAGTETNLSGVVTITGNTLTNAYYHGIDIFNFSGTISDANLSGNTITSSTSTATSKGTGIRFVAFGSASTVANVTKATIANNVISNFPSANGILASAGNGNAAGPAGVFGTLGSGTNVIAITGNRVAGQSAANRMGAFAIAATVNGKGQGSFDISSNGTVANPVANIAGTAISVGSMGNANVSATVNNNILAPNNLFGAQGIGAGTSSTFGATDLPVLVATISNNSISQTDGNGILVTARDANGTVNAKIQNNTVAAPLGGLRPGIRVDSGSTIVGSDEAVCLNISGNTSAGSGGSEGIGLRKQGTVTATHSFAVNGMAATSSPGVEAYVEGLNPGGSGTLLISALSGFSNCSLP